ncbi:hypothetical protein FGG08_006126 [Glutinoglossum americanum]|uniref:DUF7580 domain-containing protein n=1 Tax=Glutinoglossum americanum TaxID=1670608 RepID=A0A9P8HYZ6_9PEZI|nr:hypothetical protein FGG08_006126 [Glutinoglossum americanum]
MSALELGAGVISTILSTLSGYRLAQTSLADYSRPESDNRWLGAGLQLEERRFLYESHRILSLLVPPENAYDMVHEPSHHLWYMRDLEERLVAQLGSLCESLLLALQMMGHALGRISEQGKAPYVVQQTWNGGNSGAVCEGISHQTLKPLLRGWVDDLSLRNDVYSVYVSRSRKVPPVVPPVEAELNLGEGLGRLETFYMASNDLYMVLSALYSCTIHRHHAAYIKIQTSIDCTRKFTPPRVEFDLIWTQSRRTFARSQRVTVKSTLRPPAYERAQSIAPGGETAGDSTPRKSFKKKIWDIEAGFRSWSMRKHERIRSTSGSVCRRESYFAYHELGNISNLCEHLQISKQGIGGGVSAMQVIETHTPSFEHLILPSITIRDPNISESMSLAEVITWVSQDISIRGLGVRTKIRLAKLLAVSVLQFQGTPWLQGGWRSHDVAFLGVTEDTLRQGGTLMSPYLKIRFPRDGFMEALPVVPNGTLFGLAIVLLELGFETPFQSLHRKEDFQDGDGAIHAELFAAQRLLGPIQRKLGLTYARVVRKCIYCDFWFKGAIASGSDLQLVFYAEVVCALESLERKFM